MITTLWGWVSMAVAVGVALVIVGMAVAVIVSLFNGTIDLTYLLSEPAGPPGSANAAAVAAGDPPADAKASLSRFQFLIFTFVIAGVYLVLCLEAGTFVAIPENVCWLLGVSGGTFAASKGIKTLGDHASKPRPGGDAPVKTQPAAGGPAKTVRAAPASGRGGKG